MLLHTVQKVFFAFSKLLAILCLLARLPDLMCTVEIRRKFETFIFKKCNVLGLPEYKVNCCQWQGTTLNSLGQSKEDVYCLFPNIFVKKTVLKKM